MVVVDEVLDADKERVYSPRCLTRTRKVCTVHDCVKWKSILLKRYSDKLHPTSNLLEESQTFLENR